MPFFRHDNIEFHYEVTGEGVPFLAMHGLGGNYTQPKQLLEVLPDIQLITMDFRGHGKSICNCTREKGDMKTYAEDALALLDHLGIEQVLLGGISLGAAVSLKLAIIAPERVKGLILIRPAWLNRAFPENLKPFVQISQLIQEFGTEKAEDQFYESKELQIIKNFYPRAAASLMGQFSRPQALENAPLLESLAADTPFDHYEELKKITCQTLVIATKHDPLHPYDFGSRLAEAISSAIFIETASKYVHPHQHVTAVREGIIKFVRGLFK